jgi:hypothetical protein
MNSGSDTACAVGCPIRRSRDQRLLASPPGLSQRATSFIASQCQGIHQMPFSFALEHHTQRQIPEPYRYGTALTLDAATFSLCEDTCRTRTSRPSSAFRPETSVPDVPASVTSHTRFFTHSINKTQRKCHHFGAANRNFLPSCSRYRSP